VAGFDEVLGELLDAAAPRLATYGYLLTGSQHAGEDLVQDAIVKVFVRRRRIPNVRAAEGYVRAAMRTLHIDAMRREGLWRRAMPGQVATTAGDDPADAVAAQDAMGRALVTLSPQERVAVVLRYFDDLTVPAVAAAMGLADGTVKRYLSNALDKLAAVIGNEDFDVERIAVIERGE